MYFTESNPPPFRCYPWQVEGLVQTQPVPQEQQAKHAINVKLFVELRDYAMQNKSKSLACIQPVVGDAATCKSATSRPSPIGVMTHFCHPDRERWRLRHVQSWSLRGGS